MTTPRKPILPPRVDVSQTFAPDPDARAQEALSGRMEERDTGKREITTREVREVMRQRHANL